MSDNNRLPKRHHIIPQMMLRHFADEDGLLWYWRQGCEKNDVKRARPRNIFVQNNLYGFERGDGTVEVELELFLAQLEGVGATFINQLAAIIRDGLKPHLDTNAWNFWDSFSYYHLKRSPGAIAAFTEHIDFKQKIAEAALEIGKSEVGVKEADLVDRVTRNAIVIAQRAPPSPEVRAALASTGLAIYKVDNAKRSFLISDVPGALARFRLPNGKMSHPTLFIPLTWDIAVGPMAQARTVEVVEVDREQVRRMNEATTARATAIAGRSAALVRSLSSNAVSRAPSPRLCASA